MPWNAVIIDSEILAVHAALVPSGAQGEVVLFGGDEHWGDQEESAGGDKFKKRAFTTSPPTPSSVVSSIHPTATSFAAITVSRPTGVCSLQAEHQNGRR
jgi:hypothetical protein